MLQRAPCSCAVFGHLLRHRVLKRSQEAFLRKPSTLQRVNIRLTDRAHDIDILERVRGTEQGMHHFLAKQRTLQMGGVRILVAEHDQIGRFIQTGVKIITVQPLFDDFRDQRMYTRG